MANDEQLAILQQGVDAWNKWRQENPDIGKNPQGMIRAGTDTWVAARSGIDLNGADLSGADLSGADLSQTTLNGADLSGAILREAVLRDAGLIWANLSQADLSRADLSQARLIEANLSGAVLNKAALTETHLHQTSFTNIDLTDTIGLETCLHVGPSPIDHQTFSRSSNLPVSFLRGCGLSDWAIEAIKLYQPGLSPKEVTDMTKP